MAMYRLGHQQQHVPNIDISIFRDKVPYTPTVDDAALNKLIMIIRETYGLPKYTIRLISGTTFWAVIKNIYDNDRVFGNTTSEMMNGLDLVYAIDDFCTKQLLEMFPEHVTDMQHLAGAMSKSLGRTGFYRHLTETFKRHMLWSVLTNFSPVAYYPAADIARADEACDLVTRATVDRLRKTEETVLADERFRGLLGPEMVARLLKVIPGIPPDTARSIGLVFDNIRPKLSTEAARTLGGMLIETLRRQYSGYLPVAPLVDLTETVMVYVHEVDTCLLMDKRGRVFRALGEPISRSQPLSSPVARTSESTMKFQALFDDYMRAASMNAKRTVVTAPQTVAAQESRNPFTRELDSGQLSRATFENLIQLTGQLNYHQRTAIAESSGLVANPAMVSPTNTALAHMLRTNGAAIQESMLDDLNSRINDLTDQSRRFTDLKRVIGLLQSRDFETLAVHVGELHPDDRELVLHALGPSTRSAAQIDPPEIHRLPENTKLLCSFTTSINLPEIEELLHLWTITWETVFCGRNLFTRRKHALQYTTTGRHDNEPSQSIQFMFVDSLNAPGVLMDRLYPSKVTKLTFTELMVLSEKVETVTLPEIFAAQIGLNPSEVRLKNRDACEPPKEIVTGVSRELGVDGRFRVAMEDV
ncbi:ORF37 [Ictalurid herpesvirus 1]|nr:ORF37 [Ictalurid herpesvirus 1]